MSRIIELFGVYHDDGANLRDAVRSQRCPYAHKKCVKTRKSFPQMAIGTCSVLFRGKEIIICPFRLLEDDQVFIDCLHLLTMHEPGNRLYVVPEIAIPGGSVDRFLVSARDGKVRDFVGIELQTMDTTGTVWPERQRLLHEHGIEVSEGDLHDKKTFGINWKMTAKTILLQMHHKAETFEALGKHLVLIVQWPFLDYIEKEFDFRHIVGVRLGDPIHIHSYDLGWNDRKLSLSLGTRVSTDANGIAKSLGLRAQARIALEDITIAIEKKLSEHHRLLWPRPDSDGDRR